MYYLFKTRYGTYRVYKENVGCTNDYTNLDFLKKLPRSKFNFSSEYDFKEIKKLTIIKTKNILLLVDLKNKHPEIYI